MSDPGPVTDAPPRLGRARDWVIGTLLLAGLIVAVSLTTGWRTLLAPWREFGIGEVLALLALSMLSYLLRAVRVHDFFRPVLQGRFPTVLRLSVLHNGAHNLRPMRAGEMVCPGLRGRYFGHGVGRATASLVWIRLMDLHFLGLIGLFSLYLREPSPLWPLAGLLWLIMPVMLLPAGRWLPPLGDGRLGRLRRVVTETAPGSFSRTARLYLWTGLSWSVKFMAFALVLHHFLPVDLWRVILGVMGAELSSVLPIHGVAGSGSYELATVAALVPLGVSPADALAGAVNLHIFLLGVTLLLGLLAFLLPVRSLSVSRAPDARSND